MCEIIKISAQADANLLLKELVLQGLLARVGAGALKALLVLAVVLRHLPHLCAKARVTSDQNNCGSGAK